ncbi:MAG: TIGR01906 family membrane protein [Oscillospiraceae bacterium]|nr:TIGR01906 family membrane protein [Oscillospiraceae bacterium]
MKKLFLASGIVNTICLIFLLLALAVQLPAFGMWFYRWQYGANNTYEVVNMEPEDLHAVTEHMIRYMQGREPDLQIMTTVGGEARYFFSEIEIRHMVDVYDLFSVGLSIRNLAFGFFLVTLAVFFGWGKQHLRYLFRSWKIGAATVFLSLAALTALIAINWHRAFIIFHEIFFNNDYWILDARVDLLINIVPYDFFIAISVFIGAFFTLGLIAMFALGTVLKRKEALIQEWIERPTGNPGQKRDRDDSERLSGGR